jgi:hypothetical protein
MHRRSLGLAAIALIGACSDQSLLTGTASTAVSNPPPPAVDGQLDGSFDYSIAALSVAGGGGTELLSLSRSGATSTLSASNAPEKFTFVLSQTGSYNAGNGVSQLFTHGDQDQLSQAFLAALGCSVAGENASGQSYIKYTAGLGTTGKGCEIQIEQKTAATQRLFVIHNSSFDQAGNAFQPCYGNGNKLISQCFELTPMPRAVLWEYTTNADGSTTLVQIATSSPGELRFTWM